MKNQLVGINAIQERITSNQSILGMEVIGVDGCQSPYNGIIRELSVTQHRVLGTFAQVWVEWFYDGYPQGHLTPYFPKQFKKWDNGNSIGVFY